MPAHRLIAFVPLILATVAPAAEVDFNREIKPILSNHCYACHGPDEEERQARLRLDTYEGATRNRRGRQAITPGNPDASTIIEHMTSTDPDEVMPPPDKGQPLSPEQIELIKKWITEGAHYAEHWSYTPVVRPEVPELASHPIDAFLLEELAANSLTFSPQADPHRLARRAAMDLTGLPPSPDEVDAYISDQSPDAYENYINRLLAKPAYGEHMARGWLDIARYADSAGYADDPPRTIWAYRDWVIRAYNSNMPFDRFTVAQLAGDLLPEATEDDLIATAFHRNTLTNSEGGTDDEEFRNAAVVDRVGTTFEAWMGTTMACAQCHTHKYDPITHEDYFRVFAIFNNTQDADRKDESPTIGILTPEQLRQQEEWLREKEKLARVLESQAPELAAAQQAWESRLKEARPWTPASAVSQSATDGVVLTPQADASLRATGEAPAASTYTIRIRPPAGQPLAAIRLEALADPELAQGGPGRNGNFVLSNLSARWIPQQATPPTARFVRIELTGAGKMIHLAEVEAFSNGINVARAGSARQSSTDFGGDVSRAIDGNTDGNYTANSVSHTAVSTDPWIEIDLGANRPLDRVVLWNRTDGSTGERLQGYRIVLLDDARNPVWEEMPEQVPAPRSEFLLSGERSIKFSGAIATFAQDGFAAGEVLDAANLSGRGKGWAVGPKLNQSHELALTLAQPLPPGAGEIELTLAQQSPHTGHTLGRFRISTAADASAVNDLLPDDIRAIVQREPGQRTPLEIDTLARYFQSTTPLLAETRERLAAVEKGLTGIKPATTVPILREMPENQRRKTHIQLRGNFMNLGDPVEPGTPSAFPPLPEGTKADRLAFARWVVSPENPLTARATVNRLWEQVFGTGIVATTEEFGSQGDLPSHPKLLDWLAAEFVSSGWNTQHMLRLMVTSRAYRQTSRATPELLETDPANRLLARGPSVRLTAEEIRDQALAASGLLSPTMFGPPVRPPRPSFGLVAAFGETTDWVTSTGSDRYRRGVYTEIRRSMPHPSLTTFDATSREVCSLRRSRSNTPLQALVTLNDPAFVEAAQALARRLLRDHPDADPDQRLTIGFRLVIVRPPSPPELAAMKKLLDQLLADYAATPDEALTFATNPIGPLPDGMNAVDLAAWTAAAQVLLNTDEAFQKY